MEFMLCSGVIIWYMNNLFCIDIFGLELVDLAARVYI